MVSFRVICKVHTGSHQGAHEVSCPTFNDSEFDHLIKGASHYSALTPSHLDGPVPQVYEAPCCVNICQESWASSHLQSDTSSSPISCQILFPLFNYPPPFLCDFGFLTNCPFSSTIQAICETLFNEASQNLLVNTLITVHAGFSTPSFLPNY